MRYYPWVVIFMLSIAMPAWAAGQKRHASDYTRILEAGPPDQWASSIHALIGENGRMSSFAVASVLKRLPSMAAEERILIARGLRGKKNDPRAVAGLVRLTRDPDAGVREEAMKALLYGEFPLAASELAAMLTPEQPYRIKIIDKLAAVYVSRQNLARSGYASGNFGPRAAGAASHAGLREPLYLEAIVSMLSDNDADLRKAAIRAIANFVDGRVNDWLVDMTGDAVETVRMEALWQLSARGDGRACGPLFDWAVRSRGESDTDEKRHRRLAEVGRQCADQLLISYFEQYRHAGSEAARRDCQSLIQGGMDALRLDQPGVLQDIIAYTHDRDPFLRTTAQTLLNRYQQQRHEAAAKVVKAGMPQLLPVGAALFSAMFGLATFLWAFRLLNLRRFLKTAAAAKARSMALGAVTLHGQAQPKENQYIIHPDTAEPCLFYAGADRDHPGHRFYLEDDTGRVLINPDRAMFLSEDDVLLPGEPLHVMGASQPSSEGFRGNIVGKPAVVRTLFARIGHWMVQGLLGGLARRGRSKIWFSDPANCFWLWDDASQPPFASGRGLLFTLGTLALGGAWVICFSISILVMIDRSIDEQLVRAIMTLVG